MTDAASKIFEYFMWFIFLGIAYLIFFGGTLAVIKMILDLLVDIFTDSYY